MDKNKKVDSDYARNRRIERLLTIAIALFLGVVIMGMLALIIHY